MEAGGFEGGGDAFSSEPDPEMIFLDAARWLCPSLWHPTPPLPSLSPPHPHPADPAPTTQP